MSDWCPFAKKVKANATGGSFVAGYPLRGVLHSTESDRYVPSTSSYFGHRNWPHFTVYGTDVYQHIPITTAARALANPAGGVETNRAGAIQIEVVARAAKPAWPADLRVTVAKLMRWIEEQTGIRRTAPKFVPYPFSYGVHAKQRMSAPDWRSFNGWCGHQHVPENSHGDPGAIPILALLARQEPDVTPADHAKFAQAVVDAVKPLSTRLGKVEKRIGGTAKEAEGMSLRDELDTVRRALRVLLAESGVPSDKIKELGV